jgi:hypothetical protein
MFVAAVIVLPLAAEAVSITFTSTGDNTILNGSPANTNYGSIAPIASGTVSIATPDQRLSRTYF